MPFGDELILKLESIIDVTVPDVPLPAAPWQRTCTVNQSALVDTHHAHLGHRTDKSPVPSAFAKCEGIERQHGERVLCNTLVRRKREGRLAALGLGIVLVVPGANCRVKFRRLIGRGAAG